MSRPGIALVVVACVLLLSTGRAFAGLGTVVPVSAESGTSIAGNLFPVGLKLQQANLLLTAPTLIYIDAQRLGLRVRFQAYDHRPAQGIAESETGWMQLSGKLGFDQESREILLHEPSMDNLEFVRDFTATLRFNTVIIADWCALYFASETKRNPKQRRSSTYSRSRVHYIRCCDLRFLYRGSDCYANNH